MAEKRQKLRLDELARKIQAGGGFGIQGVQAKDIQHIEPVSDMLKGIFNEQTKILNREAGIDELEEEE